MTGATLREWLNVFADQHLTAQQLRKIESDEKSPWPKRAAATRALRTVESGDLCDFDDYLDGKKTLGQLRKAGIDTSVREADETPGCTRAPESNGVANWQPIEGQRGREFTAFEASTAKCRRARGALTPSNR